jgi:hypothetical protein
MSIQTSELNNLEMNKKKKSVLKSTKDKKKGNKFQCKEENRGSRVTQKNTTTTTTTKPLVPNKLG